MLPIGIRDHMPHRAENLAALDQRILEFMRQRGFQFIITPLFEKLETFEKALGSREALSDSRQFFRALDPHRGELVAFRPDILPQIARLVANRMSDWPLPIRLCYSGRVLRAEDEPGAKTREIFQIGCELIGVEDLWADMELIWYGVEILQHIGIQNFKIDLGHMGYAGGIFEDLKKNATPEKYSQIILALKKRDLSALHQLTQDKSILELPQLFSAGDEIDSLLERAGKLVANARSKQSLQELKSCVQAMKKRVPMDVLAVDLGEVRGFQYYSGIMIQGFVPKVGYPILNGGRYDHLLGRFGTDMPATGFALDLELLFSVLEEQNVSSLANGQGGFLLVSVDPPEERLWSFMKEVWQKGRRCCFTIGNRQHAQEYAKKFHYDHLIFFPSRKNDPLSWVKGKQEKKVNEKDILKELS